MFFEHVLSDQEFPPKDLADPILISLHFSGEAHGAFALTVDHPTGVRLAERFLPPLPGEALDRQQTEEVLGELANMLCGAFLGQLNYHQSFKLTSPRKVRPEQLRRTGRIYQRTVHIPSGCLHMWVAVESEGR
jgi:CheY-specific phosphatase CheX